jgi:hypothetical protein
VNQQIPPLMIALGQSKMFLAKTYTPVTQEILNLALREYNRLLAIGRPSGQALVEAKELLRRSGVDQEVSKSLLERVADGRLKASDVVLKMLNELAATQPLEPASPAAVQKTSFLPPTQ